MAAHVRCSLTLLRAFVPCCIEYLRMCIHQLMQRRRLVEGLLHFADCHSSPQPAAQTHAGRTLRPCTFTSDSQKRTHLHHDGGRTDLCRSSPCTCTRQTSTKRRYTSFQYLYENSFLTAVQLKLCDNTSSYALTGSMHVSVSSSVVSPFSRSVIHFFFFFFTFTALPTTEMPSFVLRASSVMLPATFT